MLHESRSPTIVWNFENVRANPKNVIEIEPARTSGKKQGLYDLASSPRRTDETRTRSNRENLIN